MREPTPATKPADHDRWHSTIAAVNGQTPPPGNLAVPALGHGSMVVEYYAPRGVDRQEPHTRDELYVVVAGQGTFLNGATRHPFGPGDVIFVPAGVVHRFEEFSDDFATWVIFYGPQGGEASDPEEARGEQAVEPPPATS
jgi:mannose-6-phosphate isomerase-like protein (cupin superfamily)